MAKLIIKVGLTILLCVYLVILSKLVLFKYLSISDIIAHFTFSFEGRVWDQHNFIPFKTIIFYLFLADINLDIRVINLVGNIIGFAPFGFLLPMLIKKFQSFVNTVAATFTLSITFELLQLVFKFGSFDMDDLILNTIGGALGFLAYKILLIIATYGIKKRASLHLNEKEL